MIVQKNVSTAPAGSALFGRQGKPVPGAVEKPFSVKPGFDNCSFELAAPEQMVVAPDCRSIGQGPRDLRVAVVVEDQPQETRLPSVPDAPDERTIATQDKAD